jgi:hypothetical protein
MDDAGSRKAHPAGRSNRAPGTTSSLAALDADSDAAGAAGELASDSGAAPFPQAIGTTKMDRTIGNPS